MQLEGFKFQSIYLEAENESFDLHNCFDFMGFTYDGSTRLLSLRWVPNEYSPKGERRHIVVEFHGVSHLSIEPRDPRMPFTEDTCLSAVSYALPSSPTGE